MLNNCQQPQTRANANYKDQNQPTTPPPIIICTMCLEDLKNANAVVTLKCEHKFHLKCVAKYLSKTKQEGEIILFSFII